MLMPRDPKVIKSANAYSDSQGVFNLFFKDEEGTVVSDYDPKKYGDKNVQNKIEIMPH